LSYLIFRISSVIILMLSSALEEALLTKATYYSLFF
jgi:hypothetical protein